MPEGTIVIVPAESDWNDFGYQSRADVYIVQEAGVEPYAFRAFIGFLVTNKNELNGAPLLRKLLADSRNNLISDTLNHNFFTMLNDMESYRKLIGYFGPYYGSSALAAMRDLVALQHSRVMPDFVKRAVSTDIFQKSFIRQAEAFFVYKNGGSILDGLEFEQFQKMSQQITIEFQLKGRRNAHRLRFKFDHESDLPKRIAIVIGQNGVGKSQVLKRIAQSAIEGGVELFGGEPGERVLMNRLLAFAPSNEAGAVFPSERRNKSKVYYRRFLLNRLRTKRTSAALSGEIIEIARSTGHLGRVSRWSIFANAIRAIDNWQQISLVTNSTYPRYMPLYQLHSWDGEEKVLERFAQIDITRDPVRVIGGKGFPLSSGEISFLRFSVQASLHIENGSLLLIDEPETHLHPHFISQFVLLLDAVLEKTGSAAIIATHSAYFVREVFREQVSVLRVDREGYVSVETPSLKTFGADVGAISYFVFGEDDLSKLGSSIGRKLQESFENWEEIYKRYKNDLSLELLSALREDRGRDDRQ